MPNIFKKCGKGKHKKLGYRSYKTCVKGGPTHAGKSKTDKCIKEVMNYIVESEMEGSLDENDSYYGTYMDLQDLLDKEA